MSKSEFKQKRWDVTPPVVVRLSRKQIKQMSDMIDNFKDIDDFELHVTHESGIGQSMRFRFTLDLAGEKTPVNTDVTDVSKW